MNNMIAEIVDADAPVDKKFARLRRLDDTYTRIFSQEAILADFHEHTDTRWPPRSWSGCRITSPT